MTFLNLEIGDNFGLLGTQISWFLQVIATTARSIDREEFACGVNSYTVWQ